MAEPGLSVIHVVAHTHWDREWYHTAERFRQRLVALVDELLDDPPAPGTSFLLDGQAVLLDDYLAVRPERAAELSALLRDGRLEAGPWYVLADELIPGGEALVRNLLAGRETVRRLRGEPPDVLYCPDSFGHPAILPELARGFGCALVVLWRGYGGGRWPAGDTARWRGPSGAEVVLHHLPPDGYEFGSALPADAARAADRWARLWAVLAPRATTGVALLLNGADHHARQNDHATAVDRIADCALPVEVRASSLHAASRAIVEAAASRALPTVTGELRDSHGYTWTLGGTLASRASQKRRNAIVERTLVRDVEPWLALADAGAGARALLRAAWRELLLGHPHDTLCGTSIDAVAAALDHRLAVAASQAHGLREDALLALARHDRDEARADAARWRPALVLRNPAARARSGVAEVVVAHKIADVAVGPGSATRQGVPIEPGPLPATLQRLGAARRVALTEAPRAYPKADLVEETRALAWIGGIGGYVVRTTPLEEAFVDVCPHPPVRAESSLLDNGLLRVSVDAAGAVRVEDFSRALVVIDAVRVRRARDVGDLYTPAIRDALPAPRFAGCEVTHRGPLRGELTLGFADDDGGALTLRLQLDAGLPALRVLVDGINATPDARLRLELGGDIEPFATRGGPPTGKMRDGRDQRATERPPDGANPRTVADAAFHPFERRALVVPDADAAMEHPVATAPLHRWVSRYGADVGLTVFSDGLAEYQALDDGAVAVTLLRAVGELSRVDLPERPGHAGWPASTPKAQCIGPFAAAFALALHGADADATREEVERLADDVLLPLVGETLRSNVADPHEAGGLSLDGDGLAFSAAMPAREAGWIVLRCVNRRATPVQGRWTLGIGVAEAHRARLDETIESPLVVNRSAIPFEAAPMEIVSIVARLA